MKAFAFTPPNFRCQVSRDDDPEERKFQRLCYAEGKTKAQQLLENKGLIVHQVKPYDFNDWLGKAEVEIIKIKAAFKSGGKIEDFKSFWGELKDHLLDLFAEKCAYCESDFKAVGYGDVEHYRPKGKVTEDNKHPGYYWLVYDPENYLPSCQICNQYAKKNHFPLEDPTTRANSPEDTIDNEQVLLLNPYKNIFVKHINFSPSSTLEPGHASGITKQGEKTIEIMKLNRHDLVTRRSEDQDYVRTQIKQAVSIENFEKISNLILEVRNGERKYASAAYYEIKDLESKLPFISLSSLLE